MQTRSEPLTESYYYILLCLYGEPMHGYGIMQETQRLSGGRVTVGSGTMYGATGAMMKRGWIVERELAGGYERKRVYEITAAGREALIGEVERLRLLTAGADEVFNKNRTI